MKIAPHRTLRPLATLLAALTLWGATGCQEVEAPVKLTPGQRKQVVLAEAPKPQYPVGAVFEDTIELIGFDVTRPLIAGKKATFTWYWRAKKDVRKDWKVFVHFDTKTFRNNLDHYPAAGLYPTRAWKAGEVIKDVQDVVIHPRTPTDNAVPHIGLYAGNTRMAITKAVKKTDDRRVIGPALPIKNPGMKKGARRPGKPAYVVRTIGAEAGAKKASITLDGKLDEPVWKGLPTLKLQPFGKVPDKPTWARAFITDTHLVLGAHVTDEHIWGNIKERDGKTWTEEVLELFIDPDGDGRDYLEFQITPQNVVFDANFKKMLGGRTKAERDAQIDAAKAFNIPGLETAVHVEGTLNNNKDQDKYWSVELRIPLASIPGVKGAPKPGSTWKVNMYRFDRPAPRKSFAYAWSTASRGSFHNVRGYGTWRFIGNIRGFVPGVVPPRNLKEALRKHPTPVLPVNARVKLKGAKPAPASLKSKGAKPSPGAK